MPKIQNYMSFRLLLLRSSVSVRVFYIIVSHPPSTAVPYWWYWRTGYAEEEDGLNTYICYIIIDNKYFVQCILVLLLIRRVRLGPCRAISAAAVSPGGVCQVSLVSHVPAFLLSRIATYRLLYSICEMAPTRGRSLGQAAPCSRTSSVMPDANASSIIRRLQRRAVTGRGLGITVHQHYGYRVHYTWDGAFGNRCFERRFPSYGTLSHFCITLINGVPAGLCSCIFIRQGVYGYQGSVLGDVLDLMHYRMAFCAQGLAPYIPQWLDGPWWTIQAEREW